MKTILNIILVVAACLLGYMCYRSVQLPVEFNTEVARREAVIIQRLKDIRTVQEAHRDKYQVYASSWKQLIDFAKTAEVPIVNKIGSLTDQQLADGLNEKNAWMYLCDPKKYSKEIEKFGLSKETFSRDTVFVPLLQKDSSLIRPGFNIDSICYIPFAENPSDTFRLEVGSVTTQSGYEMSLFQAQADYKTYLWDLDQQEVANKIDDKKQQEKYPGLQVGDATEANNNAGNWE
jgi:hypothetical protein